MPVVHHAAEEVARAAELGDALLELRERHVPLRLRHLPALVLDDVPEDGNHGCAGIGPGARGGNDRRGAGRERAVYAGHRRVAAGGVGRRARHRGRGPGGGGG
ncbi:MAG: hypothetical protein ACK559_01600, partial [bacterium]